MRANAIPLPKAMYTNINPILFQYLSKQKTILIQYFPTLFQYKKPSFPGQKAT